MAYCITWVPEYPVAKTAGTLISIRYIAADIMEWTVRSFLCLYSLLYMTMSVAMHMTAKIMDTANENLMTLVLHHTGCRQFVDKRI